MLLVGAVQMIRSLERLMEVDLGFVPTGRLTFEITLPESKYAGNKPVADAVDRILEQIEALGGVEAAGAVSNLPLVGSWWTSYYLEGAPLPGPAEEPRCDYDWITHDYMKALGAPLIRGRPLKASDDDFASPHVMLINEAMARRFDRDPIGRRIVLGSPDGPAFTVIGIVGDVRNWRLGDPAWPAVFLLPHQVDEDPWPIRYFVVWTRGDPLARVPEIRRAVAAVDSELPLSDVRTFEEVVAGAAAETRFRTRLLAVFAGVALVLGAIGIYGVVAYTTAQRRKEMGIRLALGARPGEILRLVLTSGLWPLAVGGAAGVAGTAALSRILEGLLYEVSPIDPVAILGVLTFLALVGLGATWPPALAAARVNPVESLRGDA